MFTINPFFRQCGSKDLKNESSNFTMGPGSLLGIVQSKEMKHSSNPTRQSKRNPTKLLNFIVKTKHNSLFCRI